MTQVTGAIEAGPAEPGESLLPDRRRSARLVARSLFLLTKPRIIELLLVTTLPTMLLAQRGVPSLRLILVTLLGGALAAGSANTLNCYIDRDIDAVMKRTSRRPLVAAVAGHGADRRGSHGHGGTGSGTAVKPGEALVSGILLGAAATLLLGFAANWLAAVLADAAILFYVFVYTIGAEAADRVQHRDRRRGRLLPGAGRLGRGDWQSELGGGRAVRGDLLLDPAALLGAGDEVP